MLSPQKHLLLGRLKKPSLQCYQQQAVSNAQAIVEAFKELGYRIVSDGTDTHLFVIDLRNKNITGIDAEKALERARIYVSRSTIPFDPQKPWVTSGIRIGTLALTSGGLKEKEAVELVQQVDKAIMQNNL